MEACTEEYDSERMFSPVSQPVNIIIDMETADPDDFFTLCFLISHPSARLRGVTLYPGSRAQVGFIKHALRILGRPEVLVGSHNPNHAKASISPFHFKLFTEEVKEEEPDGYGHEIMLNLIQKYPDCVVFTGGPPFNLSKLINEHDITIEKWFGQGGFAGQNIVPEEHILTKFKNMEACTSANFGNEASITTLLSSPKIKQRILVSKNVCHGVSYDKTMHKYINNIQNKTPALELLWKGMDIYLGKKTGKKFHDPLACAVIFDNKICEFREVEMYCTTVKGWKAWGCRLKNETNTWISISADKNKFLETLIQM